MRRIPTRCRPTRLGSRGRCSCIAIASGSSPAASKPCISGCSSPTRNRRCRNTVRNTWRPSPASARKRYLQREHLLELGPAALEYLTELTHRRPQVWIRDVDRLHELLQRHGEAALRTAFARGLAEGVFGAEYVAHHLGRELLLAVGTQQQELPL